PAVPLEGRHRARLPGAVGTEQDEDARCFRRERDAVDGCHRSVPHREVAHVDGWHDPGSYLAATVPSVLDPRRLRTELDELKAGLARRGIDTSELDRAAVLDGRQRELASRRDELRGRVKALSKAVGAARKAGDDDAAEDQARESRALSAEEQEVAGAAAAAEAALREILLR